MIDVEEFVKVLADKSDALNDTLEKFRTRI